MRSFDAALFRRASSAPGTPDGVAAVSARAACCRCGFGHLPHLLLETGGKLVLASGFPADG